MSKIRVGVVRGGLSAEHEVSLNSGSAVLENMPERYMPVDIVIDKYGEWFIEGDSSTPAKIFSQLDVVFNALHGAYGEDGQVQKIFELFKIPYTGSGVFASAIGMNKAHAKELFSREGLRTLCHRIIQEENSPPSKIIEYYRTFPQPSVIKPINGGSSIGVTIADDFNIFRQGIIDAFEFSKKVIIEEYVQGREATCGVIDKYRNKNFYALPPTEIIPPQGHVFFDNEVKYNGTTQEICPGNFSKEEKEEIMRMAIAAHKVIGARHYSRSDFIVSHRGIYILEINTLPGLTGESLFPKPCRAIGCSFPQFLDHVLQLAFQR